MLFTDMNLRSEVLSGVEAAGFEECTEVQERSIPPGSAGRDLMVQSQTGSGKTAAFLLPVFNRYVNQEVGSECVTLIIAPTRELADQIHQEAVLLGSATSLRFALCYGGVGYKKQEDDLAAQPHIIIGTPGRIMDHAKQKRIDFSRIGILVIDEADRMFDMGFYPDVRWMVSRMPGTDKRQTLLFSATLGTKVMNLAWEYMRDPVEIKVDAEQVTVDTIKQVVFHVGKNEKMSFLLGLLQRESPKSCLIFTNTKRAAENVCRMLRRHGYSSEFIMGDLPQSKRSAIIKRVKKGELPVLVATDVAARGLHVNDLEMVVNYDVPEDPENYVHRIGRTARAGKSGRAFTMACERFVYGLPAIEDYIQKKIPVEPVTDDMLSVTAQEGGSGDRKNQSQAGRSKSKRDSRDSRAGQDNRDHRDNRKAGKPAGKAAKNTGGKQKDNRRQQKSSSAVQKGSAGKAPARNSSAEERLAFYRSKYGEDFSFAEKSGSATAEKGRKSKQKKKSFWQRLFGKKDT